MTTRIRLKDITRNEFNKNVSKHNAIIAENHLIPGRCRESRWPYTDRLSFDHILMMRDTYAGHRNSPTVLQTKQPYDRIFSNDMSWDQRVHRDDRQNIKELGISGRSEDYHRVVPISSNAAYGKRYMRFYDTKPEHGTIARHKSFLGLKSSSCMPPHMVLVDRAVNRSNPC